MTQKPKISSLAAPTAEDKAVIAAMSREEYMALVREEIKAGRADIEAGRFTEVKTDEELEAFLDDVWPLHEAEIL